MLVSLMMLTVLSFMAFAPVDLGQAHGTSITYQPTQAIKIEALYDTGEPMSEAQIIVYAPDDPAKPWLQAQSDKNGQFLFIPDYTISGDWAVSIRTAGHGEMLHVPISAEGQVIVPVVNNAPSTLQTILMGAAGLWGFVGTALYFSNRKKS
ncbi:hypothetical protein QUF64_04455 [Anaerolineales bacterium HSG6]|nr:hypothetical protein [Anaerolineales bacterium HSG6]